MISGCFREEGRIKGKNYWGLFLLQYFEFDEKVKLEKFFGVRVKIQNEFNYGKNIINKY